jgi:transposase
VACYEAGPTGYDLARLLQRLGVRCEVIAPSLIPQASGDRVKTDRRDARKLAVLHRAGQLTAIRIPTPAEEGVRDLCRARADALLDRRRCRQRISSFLLRHGVVFRDGTTWTARHDTWLRARRFDDPAVQRTFERYLAIVDIRDAEVRAIEADLTAWFTDPLFADPVARLSAYRGIDQLGALGLACEVCDWRRFSTASQFMSFAGLIPSERSSGNRVRRGGLTKAGNPNVRTQLIESAWAYQFPARINQAMARRHEGLAPDVVARAWNAQLRLTRTFRRLAARKDNKKLVAAAVARELAGFVWAEMTAPTMASSSTR